MQESDFGELPDGRRAKLWTLRGTNIEARVTDFGARLVGVRAPGRDGSSNEVVLGCASVAGYVADTKTFMGATVGRYGNRIAGGHFNLDGGAYSIPANNGENALHGGPDGFDRRLWTAEAMPDAVRFRLTSPDGDQGFPGELEAEVVYRVKGDALHVEYQATTSRATVVNLTNHAYFNLQGAASTSILDHEITVPAEQFVPTDQANIPTGELMDVAGTPFDLRRATRVGEEIGAEDVQLEFGGGYDHTFVLGSPGEMKLAARLRDPISGRVLTVWTTEPGVQFYTGNYLQQGDVPRGSGGGTYGYRAGLCLETQHFPDSPNQPQFPSTVLQPGNEYRSATILEFSTEQ